MAMLGAGAGQHVPVKRNGRRAGSVNRRTGFESLHRLRRAGGHSFPAEAHNLSLTAGATRPPATAPQALMATHPACTRERTVQVGRGALFTQINIVGFRSWHLACLLSRNAPVRVRPPQPCARGDRRPTSLLSWSLRVRVPPCAHTVMETLAGFPCLPAMVRAQQSWAAPHATNDGNPGRVSDLVPVLEWKPGEPPKLAVPVRLRPGTLLAVSVNGQALRPSP